MKLPKRVWLSFALALVSLAIWSVLIEPRWIAARALNHSIAGWQGPPGLKVAVASDWPISRQGLLRVMTLERARQVVDEINAARPDAILLPGDFIAGRDSGFPAADEEIAQVLGGLKAPLGVYAVLGNHDWRQGGPAFMAALRRQGITVLDNDATPLRGTALWVVGVGDHSTVHSLPVQAVAKLPAGAQALALMHDPASFRRLPPVRGLVVAGHTHGGQVQMPFWGALIVPGTIPRSWAYGWVERGSNRMYVTSGLGVSILPLRFNIRPEWVLFTIKDGNLSP